MRLHALCWIGLGGALVAGSPVTAQSADTITVRAVSLDGPRVGFTYLSGRVVDSIDDTELRDALAGFPFISQLAWSRTSFCPA